MKRSIFLIVSLCILFSVSSASAQKYRTLRSKNPEIAKGNAKYIKSLNSKAKSILSGKSPMDKEAVKYLTYYFRDHICYGLTNLQNGGEFGKWRTEMQKLFAGARSNPARKQAVGIVAKYTGAIADSSKFHPMARYNAILMLSELNSVEANRSTKSPPIPNRKAYDRLVTYINPKQPDEIRMAALVGLMRHAELGTHPNSKSPLPSANRQPLADAALKILTQKEPAEGRSADAHEWMRRRAADVLGRLGEIGANGTVVNSLFETMLSPDVSTAIRCACAEALGRMDISKSPLTGDKLAAGLGKLAADCSTEEVDTIVALLKENRGMGEMRGGYGARRSGEFGDDPGEIVFDDELTVPTRRRLLQRLNQVRFALGEGNAPDNMGIMSFADGATLAEPVLEEIKVLVEHLKDPVSTLRELGISLRDDGGALADKFGDCSCRSGGSSRRVIVGNGLTLEQASAPNHFVDRNSIRLTVACHPAGFRLPFSCHAAKFVGRTTLISDRRVA